MFFLVPRITLVLLVVFLVLLAVRSWRRKRFVSRPSVLYRVASQMGRRSGRRSARRPAKSRPEAQSDSFRPS